MINLENASFGYDDGFALSGINLKINKGESLAVIGSNGSGKSTLLKILCGIYFLKKGTYEFEGQQINEKSMRDRKFMKVFHKKIGFVFQNTDAQLFCPTVYEEIAFGPNQMKLDEKETNLRVADCLELLHISHLADSKPYHLSEGEKKKVAIASVLAVNPDVIVLDEPMNNLDPRTKNFLKQLLLKLNKSGKTIICVTHDFQYTDGIFDRAAVLSEDHELIADGNYSDIINNKHLLESNNIL